MNRNFKYLDEIVGGRSTRSRSKKQESRLAKMLNGHTTINSGATLGQNDVVTDFCEIEAKTTQANSFSVTMADWVKLIKKCAPNKIPIMVVDFEKSKDTLAVLPYDDLAFIISQLEK